MQTLHSIAAHPTIGEPRRAHEVSLFRSLRNFAATLTIISLTTLAPAQTVYYWDTNGSTAGAGGSTPSGDWRHTGGSTKNWTTSSAGTGTTVNWVADSIARFSAGSDATGSFDVKVRNGQSVDSIYIDEGTVRVYNSTLTLSGTVPFIDVASGLTSTFDTKLLGSNGIVKNGAGTLVLNNTGNNYTGATTVNAGTLQLGTGSNILPNSTDVTIASGASLVIVDGASTETVASLAGAGSLDFGNNTFRINGTTDTTFSGAISDNGGTFRKSGTSVVTLSGDSDFTGALDLDDGALVLTHDNALGAASTGNDIGNNSSLRFSGGIDVTETDTTIRGDGGDGAGALRNLDGTNSFAASITTTGNTTFGSDAGELTVSGTTSLGTSNLTFTGAGNIVVSGNILGAGGAKLIKDGNGKVTLSGSNTYDNNTEINDGVLNIQSATALGATSSGTTVASGATLELQGGITVVNEDLTIAGTGDSGNGAVRNVSGNNNWESDVTLSADATVRSDAGKLTFGEGTTYSNIVELAGNTLTVDGAGDVWFNAQVGQSGSDTGAFTMNGTGTVTFYGDRNTYTGTTTINSGTLVVDTLNTNTEEGILGNVTIGDGSGAADSAVLRMGALVSPQANDLIKHTSVFTINSDGLFNLNNQNETIGGLVMTGGHVNVGSTGGLLTLEGDVTTNASSQTALIEGFQINLGPATRTFTVADGAASSDLTISARIFDNPGNLGLIKAGAGKMTLSGNNAYSGSTSVNAGVLAISHSNGLGTTGGGTTVTSGAALEVSGNISVGNETLTLNGTGISNGGALRNTSGNNSWAGTVSLNSSSRINSDSGTLTLNGALSGSTNALTVGGAGNTTVNSAITASTLTKDGAGTLTLGAVNAYTGTTTISAGTLKLGVNNAIPNGSAVTIASGATLDMNDTTDTVGSIAGAGTIMIGTGQLIAGGDNSSTTFSGSMTGTGLFRKEGSGTLTITSNMGYSGDLEFNSGTLEFSGATNNFGSGNVTILAGTTLRLSDATWKMNNLTLSGSGNITIDFAGTNSTLDVLGTLNIASTVTVTIRNWQDAADFWFAQNFTGAVYDTRDLAPMNYITFDDDGADPTNWTADKTIWQSFDNQITPVPEPSTYGAILLAFGAAILGFRRWRAGRKSS